MYVSKHPNYIKSSNLMFASAAIALISFLFYPGFLSSTKTIIISIISLLLVVGIAFLVRQGIDWVKYLLLVLFILGCLNLPITIIHFAEKPLMHSISIGQAVIQLLAIVLLFKVPNIPKGNAMQEFNDRLSNKNGI